MKIELTNEQILDAVRAIVDEEIPEAVRDAVLTHSKTVIKERVTARIGPVLDEMLASEQFVIGRWDDQKTPLDQLIKNAVRSYLDERVYLYSASDDRPSVRFSRTSSNNSEPTRLQAYLLFTVERFCDEHLATKMESTVASFLTERGGIDQVAREQMAKLLYEKFKL